jgi:hypothetical protein
MLQFDWSQMTEEEAQNYYDDVNWEYEHALLSSTAETKDNGQVCVVRYPMVLSK